MKTHPHTYTRQAQTHTHTHTHSHYRHHANMHSELIHSHARILPPTCCFYRGEKGKQKMYFPSTISLFCESPSGLRTQCASFPFTFFFLFVSATSSRDLLSCSERGAHCMHEDPLCKHCVVMYNACLSNSLYTAHCNKVLRMIETAAAALN